MNRPVFITQSLDDVPKGDRGSSVLLMSLSLIQFRINNLVAAVHLVLAEHLEGHKRPLPKDRTMTSASIPLSRAAVPNRESAKEKLARFLDAIRRMEAFVHHVERPQAAVKAK